MPGMQEVPDGAAEEARLLNFINLAGGFTDYANLKEIKIVRRNEIYVVDLIKLEVEGDYNQNMVLKDGDTVVVPQTFNQVYVIGQVRNPGPVKYVEGAGISAYIGHAGGFTKTAASDSIGIIRGSPEQPKIIKVKLSPFFNLGKEGNVAVLPGDIIFVPQSWYADWADTAAFMIGFRDARDAARGLLTPSQWRVNFKD